MKYRYLGPKLVEEGFRVVRMDLRGLGIQVIFKISFQ